MSLASLVTYYQGLLAAQYRTKPKARATIAIYAKQVLGDDLASELVRAFDVDAAVGMQLDTIGKYVGIPRDVGTAPIVNFFAFWNANITDPDLQNPNGFINYLTPEVISLGDTFAIPSGTTVTYYIPIVVNGDLVVDGDLIEVGTPGTQALFYQYQFQAQANTALSDSSYRLLLKLKIILNTSDNTLASIQEYLQVFFSGLVTIVDNKDMTLTYFVSPQSPLSIDVLEKYLPRPMGVGITVNLSS